MKSMLGGWTSRLRDFTFEHCVTYVFGYYRPFAEYCIPNQKAEFLTFLLPTVVDITQEITEHVWKKR